MKTMLIKWNYNYEARKIPVFNILLDLTTAQHVYKHSYFSYLTIVINYDLTDQ